MLTQSHTTWLNTTLIVTLHCWIDLIADHVEKILEDDPGQEFMNLSKWLFSGVANLCLITSDHVSILP